MQSAPSQHAHGSVARMEELYEVGEVIGTGTFGIIRKVGSPTREREQRLIEHLVTAGHKEV